MTAYESRSLCSWGFAPDVSEFMGYIDLAMYYNSAQTNQECWFVFCPNHTPTSLYKMHQNKTVLKNHKGILRKIV
jgi:hypothetical protein